MKNMTKGIALLSLIASIVVAAEALSLKQNMKQAGNLLKQITATVKDSSKNLENAKNVDQMIVNFNEVRNQTPDAGSFAEYQRLIDQELVLFKELKAALLANDTTLAQSLIQKINILKKEGHDKFD